MGKAFVIRRVDIENPVMRAAIATLHDEVFTPEEWAGRSAPTRGAWWVAFCGREPAAFAGIVPSHRIANAGYLCRAGVLERFRGHGLQKRLIAKRIAYARSQGWRWLFTETVDNPASGNSLIACGFRLFDPEQRWSREPCAVYWRREV